MSIRFSWWPSFNPNLILSKFAKARTIDGQECSFAAGAYEYWLPVLTSALRAPGVLEWQKARCIGKAISDASLELNNPDAFLIRCDRELITLSKRSLSRFVLYSTITYTGPKLIKWISDGDFRIYWQPSEKGKFQRAARRARAGLSFEREQYQVSDDECNLTTFVAHVSAANPYEAYEIANDSIDKFRGMINMLVNSTNQIHPLGSLARPHALNRFRRGQFHTMHKLDGSLATETFWYEPRWVHNHPTVKFSGGPEEFERKFRGWWRKLHLNPMKEHLSDALIRYCRALDMHEADNALIGMWQALEKLMGTDKYDVLVSRIVRLFHDTEEARQVANHLRIRRNQTVHSAHNITREAHVILHQVEQLAGQALFFYLKSGSKFRCHQELLNFLDLPLDQKLLKRHEELSRFFIQYRNRPAKGKF